MLRTAPAGATIALAGAVLLLTDVVPVWLLSVTTIYGQAGSTSVIGMALFAMSWFLLAAVAIPCARVPWALPAAAVVAVAARIVLQCGAGPEAQTYASSVALLGLLWWIVLLAGRGVSGRACARGVTAGVAAHVVLHVLLEGRPPTWGGVATGWVPVVVVCLVFLVASLTRDAYVGRGSGPSPWAWCAVGPALVIALILTGAPLRASVTAAPGHGLRQLVVVVAGVVACAAVDWVRSRRGALLAAVLLVGGVSAAVFPREVTGGVHGLWPAWQVVPQAVAAVSLGALLGVCLRATRPAGPGTATPAWLGLFAFFVACFCYFAPQEMALPYPPEAVLVVCAVLVAGAGLVRQPRPGTGRSSLRASGAAAVVAALAALACAPGAVRALPQKPSPGNGFPVRVVSYNVHVGGVSQDGRYDPDEIASVLQAQHPDVIWLSEVDRGWLVDGDHDILPWLAHTLGMTYVYAPAAGPDWGDAVLSRYPVNVAEQRALPRAGALTGAQALAVTIDVGGGDRLGLVGTHLQTEADNTTVPVEQAAAVTRMARDLGADGTPVVVTGDLNAAPGTSSLSPLDRSFRDGLRRHRPVFTSPADHPTQQLDQVYVSGAVRVTRVDVVPTTASDHRPVGFTLVSRGR